MMYRSITLPWPARVACAGECGSLPQTREQKKVQVILSDLGDRFGKRHGLTRDAFLKTPSGLATAFHAMNLVYGDHFGFNPAEDLDPAGSRQRAELLSDQFIFDDQLHYVHEGYSRKDILFLRGFARLRLNPALKGEKTRKDKVRLVNFFKEVFLESDTKVGLLSGATADKPEHWFLPNEEISEKISRPVRA